MEAWRSDSRFLLPGAVDAALVLGSAGGWREELGQFGVSVAERPGRTPPDLAVCDGSGITTAIASGARTVLVEGPARGRELTRAGYDVRRYLALPSFERPDAFIPLGRPAPIRYALLTWMGPDRRWKRLRNRMVAVVLASGGLGIPSRLVTVASRDGVVPRVVAGSAALGLPEDPDWILAPAQGDRLSRGVFLVFPPSEAAPSHVVKFARVPDWSEPFELDEAALRLLDGASEVVTRHVPRVLGRGSVDGLETSVETAARGQRMIGFLHTPESSQAKRQAIDSIAAWLGDLGRATESPPETLASERARLARDLHAGGGADPGALIEAVAVAPGVVQHNDMGTWNVVVEEGGFTVLDWESARRHGLPLWDLWYFLMDAEAHLAGAAGVDQRQEHFASLFGGRSQASGFLFRWTRRLADAHGIPRGALGSLATLCWLHYATSAAVRQDELARFGVHGESHFWRRVLESLSGRWLTDPALGPSWPALERG